MKKVINVLKYIFGISAVLCLIAELLFLSVEDFESACYTLIPLVITALCWIFYVFIKDDLEYKALLMRAYEEIPWKYVYHTSTDEIRGKIILAQLRLPGKFVGLVRTKKGNKYQYVDGDGLPYSSLSIVRYLILEP